MLLSYAKESIDIVFFDRNRRHGCSPDARLARTSSHSARGRAEGMLFKLPHLRTVADKMKLMEVGAGIQVSPNMLRLFDR